MTYIDRSHSINGVDQSKLEAFVKDFIPTFFGLDRERFQNHISGIYDTSPPNEDAEDEGQAAEEPSASRSRRAVNGKKPDLLRGVLERGRTGKPARKEKEGSTVPGSKESTPDVTSVGDEDTTGTVDGIAESGASMDMTDYRWMDHPTTGNFRGKRDFQPNEPYRRDTYNLYSNLSIYCFFRMFEILYERLAHIKANEKQVHEDVRRAKAPKAAHDLKMIDRTPSDFFVDTSVRANYYQQIIKMCEEVLKTELDLSHLEETLRRFYIQNGWQLYTFDKLLSATIKFASSILSNDAKDKSSEILNLFWKDREREETTHQKELDYRKQVEKLTKEGDIYRITFVSLIPAVRLPYALLTKPLNRINQPCVQRCKFSRRTMPHSKSTTCRPKRNGLITLLPLSPVIPPKAFLSVGPSSNEPSHPNSTRRNTTVSLIRSGAPKAWSSGSVSIVTVYCSIRERRIGGFIVKKSGPRAGKVWRPSKRKGKASLRRNS